jgi:hypothetical protein
VGELIVNAGGIRWRGTRRRSSQRMTWEELAGLLEAHLRPVPARRRR